MNKIEIEKSIYNEIIAKKQEAEHLADVKYFKALQNNEFENIDKEIRSAIIEKAQIEFASKSTQEIDSKIKELKEKRTEIMQKMNMTLEDIRPQYSCKLCNDTGFVGNSRCSCFQNKVTKALFENSNLGVNMRRTFADFNANVYDDPEFAKKFLQVGQNIVNDGGKYKVPLILLKGNVGVGKTFFLECVANELLAKNVAVVYMPAFELSQKLLEWHLGTLEEKNIMQQVFVDCDVLIIDDLGTEPIYQNVSLEYLQNIIDLRIMKNKLTMMSTNLDSDAFITRYGDRLGSRMCMSSNVLKLEIKNKDLRKNSK